MKFLLRRAAWMLLTLWVVFTITFFLMRAVPGGPFSRERQLPEAARRNFEARYNLDKPLWWQYFNDLSHDARLDFGPSMSLEDYSVNEVIAEGFPVSVSLGVIEIERFAYRMIRSSCEAYIAVGGVLQPAREIAARGHQEGGVIKASTMRIVRHRVRRMLQMQETRVAGAENRTSAIVAQ